MSLSHHRMGNVAVLRVDHEFVDVANMAIRRLYACTTAHIQLPPRDLLMLDGHLHGSFRSNVGK